MTHQPEEPFGGTEYPFPEQSRPPVDPYAPVDYPAVYPGAPAGYPPPYQGYPVDPYDPYRASRPPGTNGKAIASLVASLVGWFCCGLPSIAGAILGVVAMRETKRTGQEGYGIALAGTIIGGLTAAGWLVFMLVWLLGFLLTLHSRTYS
ncbi:DUF4190 domain-containing protein [Mycobacterium sp.]|uniref:DUF4190 domain-containing protein n=1 Tax=Mycobacterium sp. TaxID=1785 RepID=UPI002CB644B6|nr:DUF4190 domain-containing protein [Mycobacterium sp.]HME46678.1 DUF4190 domain-containing protein [Mycobacterium sp.]